MSQPLPQDRDFSPGQQVGPYRILRKLGQGGMGAVYLAVHEQIERQVALKVLHPAYSKNPQAARRFLNEARAVNRVGHPALVQVSDYGQLPDGTAYIIMEYLEGVSLRRYLEQAGGPLGEDTAARLVREIALPLAAAHDKGVVHRDLKPDNVMLVPDPRRPGATQIKIFDFGIAKMEVAAGDRTAAGALLGTPAYMSPEQVHGADIDAHTDVYSLGVMLYQMLAGKPPFVGSGPEVMAKHLFEAPPPLREAAPATSAGLLALVEAMMAKKPGERPLMAEVAARLGAGLARPAPGHTRRRLVIAAAGSALAGLVVAGVLLRRHPTVGPGARPAAPGCSAAGWCREASGVDRNLRRVWAAPGRGVWAVGDEGTVLHREGGAWRPVVSGTAVKLVGLFAAQDGPVWVAGERGTLLMLSGHAFEPVPVPTRAYLMSIWQAAPGQAWVSGKDGTLLQQTAQGFVPVESGTSENLYAVTGLPDGTLWAVGRAGTALHRGPRDAAWAALPTGTQHQLNAVWGSAPGDVWLAGKEGTLLHYDGHGFRVEPLREAADLNGLWGRSSHEIYAVGDRGSALRYDGRAWTPLESGTINDLRAVHGDEGGAVYAVGDAGTVLRWRRSSE